MNFEPNICLILQGAAAFRAPQRSIIMTPFRLKELKSTYYISVGGKGSWWKQPAYQPYEILSKYIPPKVRIMLHRGLTPDKLVGTHYGVSCMITGALITPRKYTLPLIPVYDIDRLCTYAIRLVNRWDADHVLQFFHKLVKNQEFRGIHPYILDEHKWAHYGIRTN